MCLGIPGEVIEIRREKDLLFGKVRFGGATRTICLEYVPDVQPGEYVVVHVGFAISKIDAAEAARAYAVLEDLGETLEMSGDEEQGVIPSVSEGSPAGGADHADREGVPRRLRGSE